MSEIAEQLLPSLLALPDEVRDELANRLLESLDVTRDAETDAAWAAEVDRRMGELERGEVVGVPAEAVMAKVRETIARVRAERS